MRRLVFAIITISAAVCLCAMAGTVPRLVNYQGILTDTSGMPVTGTPNLTFTIYPDSADSAPTYWTQTHTGVVVENGLFNVILGPMPDSLFAGDERWIGVQMNGDSEMKPRMRLTAVPYAFRAAVADTALVIMDVTSHNHNSLVATAGDTTVHVDSNGNTNIKGGVAIGSNYGAASAPTNKVVPQPDIDDGKKKGVISSPNIVSPAEIPNRVAPPADGMIIEGDVGIGTDSPGAKLDVAGSTRTQAFQMPTGGHVDYVLTSDSTGVGTWEPVTDVTRVPLVLYADQFAGTTVGEKITAAIETIPVGAGYPDTPGAIIDARGAVDDDDPQKRTIENNMFATLGDRTITLLLGAGTYLINTEQKIENLTSVGGVTLVGLGRATVLKPLRGMDVLTGDRVAVFEIKNVRFYLNNTNSTAIFARNVKWAER